MQPYVSGQKPMPRFFETVTKRIELFKAKQIFRKFARADRALHTAMMNMQHHMTPAKLSIAKGRLLKAQRKYNAAKQKFQCDKDHPVDRMTGPMG